MERLRAGGRPRSVGTTMDRPGGEVLERISRIPVEEVFAELGSGPEGLSSGEAGVRLGRIGPNEIAGSRGPSPRAAVARADDPPLRADALGRRDPGVRRRDATTRGGRSSPSSSSTGSSASRRSIGPSARRRRSRRSCPRRPPSHATDVARRSSPSSSSPETSCSCGRETGSRPTPASFVPRACAWTTRR